MKKISFEEYLDSDLCIYELNKLFWILSSIPLDTQKN